MLRRKVVTGSMSRKLYDSIHAEATLREEIYSEAVAEMNVLADIYEGKLPAEYDQFFPKTMPKHIINMIRLAWDDLAGDVGRRPDIIADAENASDTELARTDKLEKIAYSYLDASLPSSKAFTRKAAWWIVGTGFMCALAIPVEDRKTIRFEVRDPRTALPSAKFTVDGQILELEDIIFKSEITIAEAQKRGLWQPSTDSTSGNTFQFGKKKQMITIYEIIDAQRWTVVSSAGMMKSTVHGLGRVPAIYRTNPGPNKAGLGQFGDQVTLMVGISRMISQKMAFADRLLYPVMWVKGFESKVRIGPQVLNKLGPQGEMGQLSTPTQLQVDRDISTLERFSRILNRNTEVRQGEVDGKGAYVGAKTLESLNESIDVTIDAYWDILASGLQYLVSCALQMDEQLWPDERKSFTGIKRGNRYRDTYKPSTDINGRTFLRVEYGFARGGYQSFLETVQANQAGLIPKRRAVEELPGVADANDILRELEIEELDGFQKAAFLAEAQAGTLDVVMIAEIREEMEKTGKSLHAVVLNQREKLKRQAAQVAEAPNAGVAPVTVPEGAAVESQPSPPLPPPNMLGV